MNIVTPGSLEGAELQNYLNSKMAIEEPSAITPFGIVSTRPSFVVSVYPVFKDEIARFGTETPWTFSSELPLGGITVIRLPAAQKGKIIRRKIYAPKLLQPIVAPSILEDPARLEKCAFWYNLDSEAPLTDPNEWGYVVLEVSAGYQWTLDPRNGMTVPLPLTAQQVAEGCLVKSWATVRVPDGGGKIGLGWTDREADIPALVERLKVQQKIAFNSLVAEAFALANTQKADRIMNLHRMAYDWLELTGAPWRNAAQSLTRGKDCLLCGRTLEPKAIRCDVCGNLPKMYLEAIEDGLVLTIPDSDPIAAQMKALMATRAKKKALGDKG